MSPSRRVLPHVLVPALLALIATQASAYPADYVDIDPVFAWLDDGETVSGNFDITANNTEADDFSILFGSGTNTADVVGFDPDAEQVIGARVSFLFLDCYDLAPEVAVIDLGENDLEQVVVSPQVYFLHLTAFEVGLSVVASLNETGTLDWSITADSSALPSADGYGGSDFKVAMARLEAIVDGKSGDAGPVTPEPGSSALMAVGALLVARAGRKRVR
jgi:hypothetical protein